MNWKNVKTKQQLTTLNVKEVRKIEAHYRQLASKFIIKNGPEGCYEYARQLEIVANEDIENSFAEHELEHN